MALQGGSNNRAIGTMRTIEIAADDMLFKTLEELARTESKSLESLTREVLTQYVQKVTVRPRGFSFIGIGRSGKGDLSTRVEAALAEGADRREGWSLSG